MGVLLNKRKAISFAIAAAISGGAQAQVLEEVVVTAQKREQNIQDVGVSITALSGDQIEALGLRSSEDIAAQTPGLIATSFSGDSSVSIFSIRGVAQNDFADHQEAPTAMYVDGVYIANTGAAGFQMFDVDRVEVLRGPQGTLFGRNATGGLVHVINKKPTDEFEAYIDSTIGNFNAGRIEAAVGGAISDNVNGRFSILRDKADGYFENPTGPDMRNRDLTSWRGQIAVELSEATEVNLSVWSNVVDNNRAGAYDFRTSYMEIGDIDTDWQGSPDDTPAPNYGNQNPIGVIDKDSKGATVTLTHDFENMTLTSITDVQSLSKFYREDSDGNLSRSLDFYSDQDGDQFSQEIRLDGGDEDTKWVGGFYYLSIDGKYDSEIAMPTFGGATKNEFTLETSSWSLFGQIEQDLSDKLKVTAGLRYTSDEKEYAIDSTCSPVDTLPLGGSWNNDPAFGPNDCSWFSSFDPANPIIVEVDQVFAFDRKDDDFSGKLQLDYRISDDTLVYGGVSRGMKGGGYTAPLDGFLPANELSYEPEILTSYEAGIKATMMDGRARINAGVFHYDYDDYQGFIFQGLTSVVRNHQANITGGEVEFYISPAEGWDISLGMSKIDATVKDVEVSSGVFADQTMITAPDLSANWLVRKSWSAFCGEMSAQVDGYYVDDQQYNTTNSILASGEAYSVWNARVGYSAEHGKNSYEVSLFAKNLADEEYKTYGFDLAEFFGYTLEVYGPPRMYGLQARYNFH